DTLMSQVLAILPGFGRTPRDESTAVNPHHDWQGSRVFSCRRPDVQRQAVFARSRIAEHHVGIKVGLHTARAEAGGRTNTRPFCRRLWRLPAQWAHGWRGIGNPQKRPHLTVAA